MKQEEQKSSEDKRTKRNSVMDKKAFFEKAKKDGKEKVTTPREETNTTPRIEDSKQIDQPLSERSQDGDNPEAATEIKKRGYSFKDKLSMYSQAGAVPTKSIKSEDQVVPKSQFVKVVDETTKKLKWVEAPQKVVEKNLEEKSKIEDNSPRKTEEKKQSETGKAEIITPSKYENASPIKTVKVSPIGIENPEEHLSSEENGVDLVINENDDTIMIEEKLKEKSQLEDSKMDSRAEDNEKENRRESKSFNLAEEMENSDILGNTKLEKRSVSKDYNSLIPPTNSIPLNKSISHKLRGKKNSQDSSIMMFETTTNRSDRKNFSNYSSIKQYITEVSIPEEIAKKKLEEVKVDINLMKKSPSKKIEPQSSSTSNYFSDNAVQNKINFDDNYSGYKNLNNHSMMESQRDNRLEIVQDSKRSYNVIQQDSFITKETLSNFENLVTREKRNSKTLFQLVDLLYKIRNKVGLRVIIIIVVVIALILLIIIIKK